MSCHAWTSRSKIVLMINLLGIVLVCLLPLGLINRFNTLARTTNIPTTGYCRQQHPDDANMWDGRPRYASWQKGSRGECPVQLPHPSWVLIRSQKNMRARILVAESAHATTKHRTPIPWSVKSTLVWSTCSRFPGAVCEFRTKAWSGIFLNRDIQLEFSKAGTGPSHFSEPKGSSDSTVLGYDCLIVDFRRTLACGTNAKVHNQEHVDRQFWPI